MKLCPSRYKDIQLTHQNHVITVQPLGSEYEITVLEDSTYMFLCTNFEWCCRLWFFPSILKPPGHILHHVGSSHKMFGRRFFPPHLLHLDLAQEKPREFQFLDVRMCQNKAHIPWWGLFFLGSASARIRKKSTRWKALSASFKLFQQVDGNLGIFQLFRLFCSLP